MAIATALDGRRPQGAVGFVAGRTTTTGHDPAAAPTTAVLGRRHGWDALAEVRDEVEDLARSSGVGPFCRPAWWEVWHRYLEPDAPLVLLTVRSTERTLLGALPLTRVRRHLHARVPLAVSYVGVAGAGTGSADHVGPVTGSPEVAAALFEAADREAGHSSLYLENLDPRWAELALRLPGARATRRTGCPAVTRAPDGAFSDSWTKKMAKNVRRRHRQMTEEGITARWVPAGDGFDDALRALRRVHEGRWNAQGGAGNLDDDRMRLLAELADRGRAPDTPWILLLEQGDRVAAAMLGLRAGDSFCVYKTGWDPEFARLSLGIVMGTVAMEWAQEQGLHTFDYLRGDRGHKKDLGCEAVEDTCVLVPRGAAGRLLEQRERLASDGIRPGWYEPATGAIGRVRHALPGG
ncbi:MAG: GNAT family N-acetyltransferase [Microthrixaceae bacterium]